MKNIKGKGWEGNISLRKGKVCGLIYIDDSPRITLRAVLTAQSAVWQMQDRIDFYLHTTLSGLGFTLISVNGLLASRL